MADNIDYVKSSGTRCSTRFSSGTTAFLVTIPMSSGYNFWEGPEIGQVERLKFTHIITNKRFGTTVRIIH